jgi:hypothetical protein
VPQLVRRTIMTAILFLGAGAGLLACWSHLDCDEADGQAQALLIEFGSCPEAQPCRALYLPPHLENANELGICVDAFVCSVALREDADQGAFVRRARDVVQRRRCNSCTLAKCKLPETVQAFCDPETKRCKLR